MATTKNTYQFEIYFQESKIYAVLEGLKDTHFHLILITNFNDTATMDDDLGSDDERC